MDIDIESGIGEIGLSLLPVRDIVVFPNMVISIFVGRRRSITGVKRAVNEGRLIFIASQKDAKVESPSVEDIYRVGSVAQILRVIKLSEGGLKIVVQGLFRGRIKSFISSDPCFKVSVEALHVPEEPGETSLEILAQMRHIKDQLERLIFLGRMIAPDILVMMDKVDLPGKLSDAVMANLGLKVEDAQAVLEMLDTPQRLKKINELLNREFELLSMQHKIQTEAKEEMSKTHREYFLREQLKAIQKELGEVDDKTEEINELKGKIRAAGMTAEVEKEAEKQLNRLERMHPESAEASMVRTYLEWLTNLPWDRATKDNLDLKRASKILDEDHYDLEKIKERILEYLGVTKLKKDSRGPILCFVGPPGVGKTSLGRSIARAMGRNFVRISLGGVRDEAEIRGHRRTYVGALPGRIIQGIRQAGSKNPVFMIDEIDKIGLDFRGDPSAALLEVLDPDQNFSFSDHYLGVPFDLSNVMFIMTANMTDPIPSALKDRMEVIRLSGYTEEEKLIIARKYLLPRQIEENGLRRKSLQMSDNTIKMIIKQYTREAGLRNLERELANVCRKVAKRIAQREGETFRITPKNLPRYLGVQRFIPETEQETDEVGVATGLTWTQAGGEVIYVEATTMKGKGKLILTGHLGDVMKESAQAALSYTRSRSSRLGIRPNYFAQRDVHLHVPAGAVPKDGPSAGITMAAALVSVVSGIPIRRDVAMTGEITLRGKVLPVDGIKEKVLAAKRAGIKKVILPEGNRVGLDDLPRYATRDIYFVFVKEMDQVLNHVLAEKLPAEALPEEPLIKLPRPVERPLART